ncbi:MAG: undecaprenyl/decaprenyl-phosphate alpha-N-acetylglucosaminyl 1-phosphate transferase [Phycisphaerae bacterium]|nr:undecaprenyl/decaprenyl-phosphate alpha-N-acetylglucosaminyl 1-phosphate transferase [Phycisphaerae bacterium]
MESFAAILHKYQYFGVAAFIATVFLTPLAIRAAHRFGVLDVPDQKLKPHAKPIPYLGGTAICVAWALAVTSAMATGTCEWHKMLPLLLGGVGMSVLGLIDDMRHISPKIRLLAGTLMIAAVLISTRAGFRLVDSVLEPLGVELPDWLATTASFLLGLFIVLGACNSTNLIDGLDGLSTGVTGVISLGFFLLAAHLAVYGYSSTGDPVRLVLAVAMFGATLGFLPWNFNPAKIFMGDAGSVLLGFNCGMLILLFGERGIPRWVIGALMIFALPVFDTALAMVRRWLAGRSIFEGDRSHFYDQLVQRGLSIRQTVLVCYLLAIIFAAIGLLVIFVRTWHAFFIYLGVCLLTALLAWATGLVQPEEPRRNKQLPPEED